MSEEKEEKTEGQRRTYVLPAELYERIIAFQKEKGYPSEVEAVRRLLDEALKSRDTVDTILDRFKDRLKTLPIPHEIAKDVLIGHPLVANIGFEGDAVTFSLKGDSYTYKVRPDGRFQRSAYGDDWERYPIMDDEIPF